MTMPNDGNCPAWLRELTEDQRLNTSEINHPNDFYGHADCMKKYAGYGHTYAIKAVVEHGLSFDDNVWDRDLATPLPAMLVNSPYRVTRLAPRTSKHLQAIGPIIHYADPMPVGNLEDDRPEDRTLLVMPAHSGYDLTVQFDQTGFLEAIDRVGKDFDRIRVCLYWRDVQLGRASMYAERGYEVTSAGHMFDKNFLRRLKTILGSSSLTMFNNFCSAMAYSIHMGIPVYYWFTDIAFKAVSQEIYDREFTAWHKGHFGEGNIAVRNAFSELRSDISPQQQEIARMYFGTDHVLSPGEMASLLVWLDDLYENGTKSSVEPMTMQLVPRGARHRGLPAAVERMDSMMQRGCLRPTDAARPCGNAANNVDRPMIELAGPVLGPEEKQAVLEVLDSGWLTMGEKVRAFERNFAAMHGAEDALGVNSCTSALHLALLALGIAAPDEVIVPTVTFVATVNTVLYTGARPVMADITDPAVPLLLPENAAPLVTPRTRAVVVVHYGGYEADMAAWRSFCDRHGLYLVVDAAHATGVAFAAREADAACFSFFPNKNMTTAEGGMLLARDPEVLARARGLRSHGMTTLTLERHKGHAYSYDVTMLGHNYRLDELRAALGLAQLSRLPGMNARRAELSVLYRKLLEKDVPRVRMTFNKDWPTAAHLVTLLLPNDVDRLSIMRSLRERKVQSSIHYPPVHCFSCHKALLGEVSLPVSEEYCRRTLTLPLHPSLSEDDVVYVVYCLYAALRN